MTRHTDWSPDHPYRCPYCGNFGSRDEMVNTIVQIVEDGEAGAERWRVHTACLEDANRGEDLP